VLAAGERNNSLPAGVVLAAQHRHWAQFVWGVSRAVEACAAWVAGYVDEWHADTRGQADARS